MSDNPYSPASGAYGAQTVDGSAGAPQTGRSQPSGGGSAILQGLEAAASPPAEGLIKDTTTATFAADVIQESRNQPVLVDFWAPWCGPCKQLTPILEKAVTAARGKVKLVKMNIDEHPSIAGQLGIQSIPAVFAFVGGQPVDGFMGALPESELKAFIDRIVRQKPARGAGAQGQEDPIAQALGEAQRLLAEGQTPEAAQLFDAVRQHDPENVAAYAGLAECYLAAGEREAARATIDAAPAAQAGASEDPAIVAVRAKLKLGEEIAQLGDPAKLEARLAADPDDHRARYDLALIAHARGDRDMAAEHLLEIIRRDRTFEDDGARRKLLEFFEAWGPADAATKNARRRLSSLLFS